MKAKPLAIAASMLLSGCGNVMQLGLEYADAPPVMIPIQIERSFITGVGVQLHPSNHNRAYVVARDGVADESWKNGNTGWIARMDEFRAAYTGALLTVLSRNGKQCTVSRSIPNPDAYAIEFEFDCTRGDTG